MTFQLPFLGGSTLARRLRAALIILPAAAGCHRAGTSATGTPSSGVSGQASASPTCVAPTAGSSASLASTPVTDPLVTFDTAWTIIARTHWDSTYNGVNWKAVREELRPRAAAAKTTGELRGILSDMVSRLKQSHFSIIPREVSDATGASGKSAGGSGARDMSGTIGATLRYVDRAVMVTAVDPGGSAAMAGVKPGWTLDSVDGCALAPRLARIPANVDPRRTALLAYGTGVGALAGPVGDSVRATFRDGKGQARAL